MNLQCHIRRIHAPLVAVLIACLVTVGCKTGSGPWGEERVGMTLPQHAYATQDGSLLLGFHIERKLHPWRSGWHWVVLDPEKVNKVMDEPMKSHHFYANGKNAEEPLEITPGLLRRGLDEPTPPGKFGEVEKWTVLKGEATSQVYVFGPDRTPITAGMVSIYASEQYVSPIKRGLQIASIPVLLPVFAVAAVTAVGFLIYIIAYCEISGKKFGWGGP